MVDKEIQAIHRLSVIYTLTLEKVVTSTALPNLLTPLKPTLALIPAHLGSFSDAGDSPCPHIKGYLGSFANASNQLLAASTSLNRFCSRSGGKQDTRSKTTYSNALPAASRQPSPLGSRSGLDVRRHNIHESPRLPNRSFWRARWLVHIVRCIL